MSHPNGMTAEDYEALPEEVSRRIEIVDGAVLVTPARFPAHQRVSRRLANALERVVERPFEVDVEVDVQLLDLPLLVRRPDVVVYDAESAGPRRLLSAECLLLVEVMSPGSVAIDRLDKPAEYASAGIEHYWRIEDIDRDQRTMTVFRYRLDPTARRYAHAGVDTCVLSVGDPFELTIDLADLY